MPLAGVAVSQFPPPDTAAATVYASGPGVPETVMVCAAGAGAPCTCVNVSDAGAAEIVPGSTCSVTATFIGLPEAVGDAIVTVPL